MFTATAKVWESVNRKWEGWCQCRRQWANGKLWYYWPPGLLGKWRRHPVVVVVPHLLSNPPPHEIITRPSPTNTRPDLLPAAGSENVPQAWFKCGSGRDRTPTVHRNVQKKLRLIFDPDHDHEGEKTAASFWLWRWEMLPTIIVLMHQFDTREFNFESNNKSWYHWEWQLTSNSLESNYLLCSWNHDEPSKVSTSTMQQKDKYLVLLSRHISW